MEATYIAKGGEKLLKQEWEYISSIKKKNRVLLYSTENYIQFPVINHTRKDYEKE